jgi:5-methylcytosine-specific restriction protein A
VEVHHIIHLAENGEDCLENTVALCPTHHRLLHYGKEREVLILSIKEMRMADAPPQA